MANNTPGPWEATNSYTTIYGPLGGDSGDGCKTDYNDGWMVAEVQNYQSFVNGELTELGEGPRKANAQLIAAAPELLEAAKYMSEVAASCIAKGQVEKDGELCRSIDQAIEAIAKAEGRKDEST